MFELNENEIDVKFKIYAIWRSEYLFNTTRKYAVKQNDKKYSLISFLRKRTGMNFSNHLHMLLEGLNEKKDVRLCRNMTWREICNVLQEKYNVKFKYNNGKVTCNHIAMDDIIFLVEYSQWLSKRSKVRKTEQKTVSIKSKLNEQITSQIINT